MTSKKIVIYDVEKDAIKLKKCLSGCENLENFLKSSKRSLNSWKDAKINICVLGDDKCGKKSLIEALLGAKIEPTCENSDNEEPTLKKVSRSRHDIIDIKFVSNLCKTSVHGKLISDIAKKSNLKSLPEQAKNVYFYHPNNENIRLWLVVNKAHLNN